MKNYLLVILAVLTFAISQSSFADYATTPQPQPYPPAYYPGQPAYPAQSYPVYGAYPYPTMAPLYPQPYVTCYAQGLANGAYFYGVGLNLYSANQWAFYACQSTGQYCRALGCR